MSLARASWIIVVALCALAAGLLLLNDYTGYSIVVAAVGLAAAVNLLPSPYGSGPPSELPSPVPPPPEESPAEASSSEPAPPDTDVSGST